MRERFGVTTLQFDSEEARRSIESAISGSPLAAQFGMRIHALDPERGAVEVGFTPGPAFTQTFDVIQGGAVATMLDFAMGMAMHARLPESRRFASVSLNVSFLRAVKPGPCIVTGEIERMGRRLVFARAALRGPDGSIGATATSVLAIADDGASGG
jgi:uncharacterized protein (TIGR00369 family)